MFALVDKWKSSETTQKQFYAEHNLQVGTFAYWVTKHKRAGSNSKPAGGFVGVNVSEPEGSTTVRITIKRWFAGPSWCSWLRESRCNPPDKPGDMRDKIVVFSL